MTDDGAPLADEGFSARVLGDVSGIANYMCGFTTEPECRAAVKALYPSEDVKITLGRLSTAAVIDLKLKVGEVRVYS